MSSLSIVHSDEPLPLRELVHLADIQLHKRDRMLLSAYDRDYTFALAVQTLQKQVGLHAGEGKLHPRLDVITQREHKDLSYDIMDAPEHNYSLTEARKRPGYYGKTLDSLKAAANDTLIQAQKHVIDVLKEKGIYDEDAIEATNHLTRVLFENARICVPRAPFQQKSIQSLYEDTLFGPVVNNSDAFQAAPLDELKAWQKNSIALLGALLSEECGIESSRVEDARKELTETIKAIDTSLRGKSRVMQDGQFQYPVLNYLDIQNTVDRFEHFGREYIRSAKEAGLIPADVDYTTLAEHGKRLDEILLQETGLIRHISSSAKGAEREAEDQVRADVRQLLGKSVTMDSPAH